jgi:hypothetical protein
MTGTVARTVAITRAIERSALEVTKGKRQVRAIWSTDEGDHYRTAFVQQGIDTSAFASNPVILYEHGKSERGPLPVANATEWGLDRFKGRNCLIGAARFWEDSFSEARFQDYADGRLKGWSINVIAMDARPPTPAERRARADWANLDVVYESTRLVEVSAVSVPGNQNTLTIGVERSVRGAAVTKATYNRSFLETIRQASQADFKLAWRTILDAIWDQPFDSSLNPAIVRAQRDMAAHDQQMADEEAASSGQYAGMTDQQIIARIERLKLESLLQHLEDSAANKAYYKGQGAMMGKMKAGY